MSSANTRLLLLLIHLDSFYFFFSSDSCGQDFQTILNSSGESGHPCLVSDFRGNAFKFSPLRIMFAVGLPDVKS